MTRKQTINAVLGTLAFIVLFGIADTLDREDVAAQKEAIEQLGWSDDVDKTLEEIKTQSLQDVFEPTE